MRGKLMRRGDMFNVIAAIAAHSLDGELRVYGVHRYSLWIEAGSLSRASSTDPQLGAAADIFGAALCAQEGFFDFVPALVSIRSSAASPALRLPLEALLCSAADRVAHEAPVAALVDDGRVVEAGRTLLCAFNQLLSEIFDAVAVYGDTVRSTSQVQALIVEADLSAYIGELQDGFGVLVEPTLAALERRGDAQAPNTLALYELLQHVVTFALHAAGGSVPRHAEMALAKHVHQRLRAMTAPQPALYVTRH
jgi:hypothetical protein